ncbi:13100_t:CDS:2 [Dentiscutata erythropus]|uniref:13100_t:CDS:1 n=1 Tax=Dentiscutata erythropus TaxID=1348616 RepID=A0A9N9FDM8_9GLOM|nr:13100_t:CDS:2 [Dentiscutata erythropus]
MPPSYGCRNHNDQEDPQKDNEKLCLPSCGQRSLQKEHCEGHSLHESQSSFYESEKMVQSLTEVSSK